MVPVRVNFTGSLDPAVNKVPFDTDTVATVN